MDGKIDIKSLSFEELNKVVQDLGEKSFRAKQIYEWLHVKLASSFDEMSNLSIALREKLKEHIVEYISTFLGVTVETINLYEEADQYGYKLY